MPDLAGQSVLVTGANGFIGSHLVARLEMLDANVIPVVPPKADLWRWDRLGIRSQALRCDLTDPTQLHSLAEASAPTHVFSLAVDRGTDNWSRAVMLNALAPLTLMELFGGKRLQRFVTIGTSLEVAREPDPLPLTQHGASKACGLQVMQAYALAHGVPYSPLRTYYVYGPLQSDTKLIPVAMRCALDGTAMSLTDQEVCKRYIHVGDVVAGCLAVLDRPARPMRVKELVGEELVSNARLIELVGEVTGRAIKIDDCAYAPRSWDRADWAIPSPDADILEGWSPEWSLEEGLKDCLNAMRAQHA